MLGEGREKKVKERGSGGSKGIKVILKIESGERGIKRGLSG